MSTRKPGRSGDTKTQVYRAFAKKRFFHNPLAVGALRVFYLLVFVALFSDFLANDKPIYCKLEGQHYFPVFREYLVDLGWGGWPEPLFSQDWREYPYERALFAPIPYSASGSDRNNSGFISPFDPQSIPSLKYRHWLGTDEIGRDVLAGMIRGTRTALLVGLVSMAFAGVIGIVLGASAGYFGDDRLSLSRGRLIVNLLFLPLAVFYAFLAPVYALNLGDQRGWQILLSICIFFALLWLFNLIFSRIAKAGRGGKAPWWRQQIRMPLDLLIMRLIEVVNSIPALLLILAAVAVIRKPSLFYIMVIIGLIRWTGIARFVRGELLKIRKLPYVESTQAMGFDERRIILRHALPNALTPVLITLAFGIASAILIEASLSFLGIGVPLGEVTWGSMLSKARTNFSAWWLALFPGLAIFVTVTVFNLIGEGLSDALNPKT